jgi:hypothetical protein
MRKRKVIVLVTALLLVAAACDKVRVQTYGPTSTSPSNQAVLTPDGPTSYRFVSAPANTVAASVDSAGGNVRQIFWPGDNPVLPDTESCAIWSGQSGAHVQQGAALRIRQDGSRVRAVTVTKNVFLDATWIFNFHVWDTSKSPAYTPIGATNLEAALRHDGIVTPLPWHFCARVIGSKLEFKVWTATDAFEPAWGDRNHGGSVQLPAGWEAPGKAGWFVGHIQPNNTAVFNDLATYKWVDPK